MEGPKGHGGSTFRSQPALLPSHLSLSHSTAYPEAQQYLPRQAQQLPWGIHKPHKGKEGQRGKVEFRRAWVVWKGNLLH